MLYNYSDNRTALGMHLYRAGKVALTVVHLSDHWARPEAFGWEWAWTTSGTDGVKTRAQCRALLLQLRQPTRTWTLTFPRAVTNTLQTPLRYMQQTEILLMSLEGERSLFLVVSLTAMQQRCQEPRKCFLKRKEKKHLWSNALTFDGGKNKSSLKSKQKVSGTNQVLMYWQLSGVENTGEDKSKNRWKDEWRDLRLLTGANRGNDGKATAGILPTCC